MAKSRKRKASRSRRPAFYEAVPATFTPPTPDVAFRAGEGLLVLAEWWYKLRGRWPEVRAAVSTGQRQLGRGAGRAGQRSLSLLLAGGLLGMRAAWTGAEAAVTYAPPAAADLSHAGRRAARALVSRRARITYVVLLAIGTTTAAGMGAVMAAKTLNAYANAISSPAALLANKKTGVTILDRNSKVLFEGYGGQDTKVDALSDLPANLKNATLAAEDPTFFDHAGVSFKAIARAAIADATHGGAVEGGSTITQQLVKNALLTSNKNLERKFEEIVLSTELEHRYSKSEILDMYLNEIYYGQGASGVEAAAQTYFHEPAGQLTLGQSALLAGLPLGPSRFDPNYDRTSATDRRNYVLDRMQALGKITKSEADAAKAQPIQLAASGAAVTAPAGSHPMVVYAKTANVQAPWFVFYVLDQLRAQYGDDVVEQGGITVQTTLDLGDEQAAENIISNQINNLSSHHVTDGALISLKPGTGDILAMVGSSDYNAPGFGNVNATLSQLQPGSSFKPIAYATAFKKDWNGASTVVDEPVSFPQDDGTVYAPQNYDLQFHGTVTLRHALDNSLNIPAIKVLQFATIPDTLQTAHDMGITSLNDPSRYGLSLVLGGGEVEPIDMATVYATLDNGGVKVAPRAILKVTDRHGQDITKTVQPAPKQVLDPRIAYMLTNIMSDNPARLPEFPLNGPLQLDRPAAAKTGTTNDFRDNWTIGYTPQLVTAVWVGNADHTAMENVDGITGAAPIWHNFMETALAGQPAENFTVPTGVTMAKVCAADGGLANPWDVGVYDEVFMTDAMPTRMCASGAPSTTTNYNPTPTSPAGDPGDNNQPENTPAATPEPAPTPPARGRFPIFR